MSKLIYDVVVIGAGSGGLTSAVGLAKIGKSVLLVEREHMGGECTNSGCIPSKALLHYAKTYHTAVRVGGQTESSETYRKGAFTYVRQIINSILAEETAEHFSKLGITVVKGEALFTSKNTVKVSELEYTFKKAIIATGSSPRPLIITGLDEAAILTNQNLFSETETPSRTLIIGGGPIGMEIGQALALLGSSVTIVENGPRFARLEDEAISPIITKTFTDLGIVIETNAGVARVDGNQAFIEIKNEHGEVIKSTTVDFDKVLIAIGRVPNIPQGLKEAGIASNNFGITVNQNWQTTNKNVYALGDVAARLKFTHVADDTGRQVIAHIASYGMIGVKEKQVPKVTYTEPEIGQVGLAWSEAKDQYGEHTILRIEVPLSGNDRARTDEATNGLMIIIAKRLTGKILGAHLIAPRAGEMIGTITLAMEQGVSLYRLRSTIFAYPTYSLLLKKAGDYFLAKQFATLQSDLLNLVRSLGPKLLIALVWLWGLTELYTYQQTFSLTPSELSLKIFTAITATSLAPLWYILAYTIRPITFLPGTALTILSGVFFGLWGILYTIIGANLSAALAYGIGRFFSKETTNKKSLLTTWAEPLKEHPFLTILTLRLTFFPFDLVNYGAGIFRVPFVPYLLATVLGTLLGIATFVAIGASLSVEEFAKDGISANAIDTKFIILSVAIFLISLVLARIMKKQ